MNVGNSETSQNPSVSLIELASTVFPKLTQGERRVLAAAERGDTVYLRASLPPEAGTEQDEESDDFTVTATLIRWLCSDKKAIGSLGGAGIQLTGARIRGRLNLSYANVPFPLEIINSNIPDGIDLESASLGRLSLNGSKVGDVWAIGLKTQGDVSLGNKFHCNGRVILDRSQIGGRLDCATGIFLNPDDVALSVFGGKIEGAANFSQVVAKGEVNLRACSIGGNLVLNGAQFENCDEEISDVGGTNETKVPENQRTTVISKLRSKLLRWLEKLRRRRGKQISTEVPRRKISDQKNDKTEKVALACDQLQVGGSAFLRRGLQIKGQAVMILAKIGGDLDCREASFSNPGRRALVAERITVGSDASFDRSETDGFIVLQSATIAGNLSFTGMRFIGAKSCGVNIEIATVERSLDWHCIHTTPEMSLKLDDATVGRLLDDEKSWPKRGYLSLFGFKYGRISGVTNPKLRREWLKRGRAGASLQPYEQLASVMKASGHEAEAKKIAISREDARRQFGGLGLFGRIWKYFLKITIGYGYAPRRILIWAAGAIVLGWVVFGVGYQKKLFSPTADGVYRDQDYLRSEVLPDGYQTFNPFIYSLDSFLPIVDLHQESKWLPNPARKFAAEGKEIAGGYYLRIYLWIHIIIGWALTTLAVAGFTGIVRKD